MLHPKYTPKKQNCLFVTFNQTSNLNEHIIIHRILIRNNNKAKQDLGSLISIVF